MKNALLSVSNKSGLIKLAGTLVASGFKLFATGNTYNYIKEAKIEVNKIESLTHFPELMDGRVKTLHPVIHGGILGKRDNSKHQKEALNHHIPWIDLVVVNLYPFKETVLDESNDDDAIIEQIDIGGPTLIRSAAKNHKDVGVVVDPSDYDNVIKEIENEGRLSSKTKRVLAAKAFSHTAQYDAIIANYFNDEAYPDHLTLTFDKKTTLRYGENPHQSAAFYQNVMNNDKQLSNYEPFHGKPLSYNNIIDINAAVALIKTFKAPTAVALKHTNPCGVASSTSLLDAFDKAYQADPISIFGGIVVLNGKVEISLAKKLHALFLEIIIAPDFDEEAKTLLKSKKNLRLIKLDLNHQDHFEVKSVNQGLLVQIIDDVDDYNLEILTEKKPSEKDIEELLFAYKVVKHVKSNAIVISKDHMTLGIGAGQMNRVGAALIACNQAGENALGAYMASDGFFPMPDTIELAKKASIKAIIQPAGSIKDQRVIEACNKHGIIMVKTSIRHFKH
jgi:phosphoribosylaminoimidazolecarboxamide formyltransferase/IMP cyclohydrolase